MSFLRMHLIVGLAAVTAACSNTTEPGAARLALNGADASRSSVVPTGTIHSSLTQPSNTEKFRLDYHYGPVMPGTSDVYLVWYGNWNGNTTPAITTDMVSNLGSSEYFKVVTRYPNGNGTAPNGALIYGGSVDVGYPYGFSLTRADVRSIVTGTMLSGQLPMDAAGIYVVLTSADVTIEGFATSWCGYHDATDIMGTTHKYVVIGSPDRALTVCRPQSSSPNDNPGADATASHLAALLASTVTSPTLVSWFDRSGLEVAQKCAWTFGTTYQAPNGTQANVQLGQRHFLLQRLWWPSRKGPGSCSLAAP